MEAWFILYCSMLYSVVTVVMARSTDMSNEYKQIITCEGSTMTITCPEKHIIKITSVMYGRINQVFCRVNNKQYLDTVTCKSSKAMSIVLNECSNRQACLIIVSNDVFSDVCPGVPKYLMTTYSCQLLMPWVLDATTPSTTDARRPSRTTREGSHHQTLSPSSPSQPRKSTIADSGNKELSSTEPAQCQCPPGGDGYGIHWPSTLCRSYSTQNCNDSPLLMSRYCANNRWHITNNSQCTDPRMNYILGEIQKATVVTQQILDMINTQQDTRKPSTQGDFKASVQILEKVISMNYTNDNETRMTVIDATGRLLSDRHLTTYKSMSALQRKLQVMQFMHMIQAQANESQLSTVNTSNLELTIIDNVKEDSVFKADGNVVYFNNPGFKDTNVVVTVYKTLKNILNIENAGLPDQSKKLGSNVVDISFQNNSRNTQFQDSFTFVLSVQDTKSMQKIECAFIDTSAKSDHLNFSTKGCQVDSITRSHVTCKCNHLTSFAILFSNNIINDDKLQPYPSLVSTSLDYITYIGSAMSLVALLICIFSFSLLTGKNLKNDSQSNTAINRISKYLTLSMFFAQASFLFTNLYQPHPILCTIIAICVHYWYLCTVFWMGVASFSIYVDIVVVMYSRKYNLKTLYFGLFAFVIPLFIVGAALGVYKRTGSGDGYVDIEKSCWLFDDCLKYFFLIPVAIILIINLVLSILVFLRVYFKQVLDGNNKNISTSKVENSKMKMLGVFFTLQTISGSSWIFGILFRFYPHVIAFAYLFTIACSVQGLLIFYLLIWSSKNSKSQLLKFLTKKRWISKSLHDKLTKSSTASATYTTENSHQMKPSTVSKKQSTQNSSVNSESIYKRIESKKLDSDIYLEPKKIKDADLSGTIDVKQYYLSPSNSVKQAKARKHMEDQLRIKEQQGLLAHQPDYEEIKDLPYKPNDISTDISAQSTMKSVHEIDCHANQEEEDEEDQFLTIVTKSPTITNTAIYSDIK